MLLLILIISILFLLLFYSAKHVILAISAFLMTLKTNTVIGGNQGDIILDGLNCVYNLRKYANDNTFLTSTKFYKYLHDLCRFMTEDFPGRTIHVCLKNFARSMTMSKPDFYNHFRNNQLITPDEKTDDVYDIILIISRKFNRIIFHYANGFDESKDQTDHYLNGRDDLLALLLYTQTSLTSDQEQLTDPKLVSNDAYKDIQDFDKILPFMYSRVNYAKIKDKWIDPHNITPQYLKNKYDRDYHFELKFDRSHQSGLFYDKLINKPTMIIRV